MKKKITFLILIITTLFGYGQSNKEVQNIREELGLKYKLNRFSYLSYNINKTQLIGALVGGGLGQGYDIEEYKIKLVTSSGTYIGDFFDYANGKNKDYKNQDAQFQTSISLNANIMIYKYFSLSEKYSLGLGLGIDFLYSPGQSIKFNDPLKKDLLGKDNIFFNFLPEIYFRSEKGIGYLFDTPVEFFVNYNISINSEKVFTDNTTPNYRYSFVGIGFRFDILE